MQLIKASNSFNSVVICPQKYGNLARFLSGTNNYNYQSMKNKNVNKE